MKTDEDLDLRQEFVRLRREEAAMLSPFRSTLDAVRRRASARPRPIRWGFAVAAPLAATAALALWLLARQETPQSTAAPTEVAAALENWSTPTDYLLDSPGIDLLDSLPELGDTDSYDMQLTTDLEPRADSSASGTRRYA